MNLSVNGQSQVPPGFRFHPTEEELLHYYLRKKVAYKKIDLDVIRDVDLNKLEPWDIQEKCKIGSSTPQSDWYFFSHKDKKYPTGTRTNRATTAGFWKATGRDKVIYSSLRRIGMRKTLVFYKGRAPHGQKSDWIMHEYRLELDDTFTTHHDANKANNLAAAAAGGGGGGGDYSVSEEGWVVCRVFKKKNYHRALEIESPQRQRQSPSTSSMNMDHSRNQLMVIRNSSNDGGIADQILEYMGRSCKQDENETTTTTSNNGNINMPSSSLINIINTVHLPSLEESDSPTILPSSSSSSLNNKYCYSSPSFFNHHHEEEGCTTTTTTTTTTTFKDYGGGGQSMGPLNHHHQKDGVINDWAAFDRLVASQLNGPGPEQDAKDDTSNHLSSCYNYGYRYGDPNVDFCFSIDGHDHDDVVQLSQLPSSSRPNIQPSSSQVQSTEIDLWSFTRSLSSSSSCSDPLCHLSV